jgi:GDP-mannose pyrophosphatase NudK
MIQVINILHTETLSDNWYTLKKVTYEYVKGNGERKVQTVKPMTGVMVL